MLGSSFLLVFLSSCSLFIMLPLVTTFGVFLSFNCCKILEASNSNLCCSEQILLHSNLLSHKGLILSVFWGELS